MAPHENSQVAVDISGDQDQAAQTLRERLMRIRRLRYYQPADREDVVHEVIVRLLEQANEEGVSFMKLTTDDKTVRRHTDASRSALRRRLGRDAQMQEVDKSFSSAALPFVEQLDRRELAGRVEKHVSLSERERLFFQLWYVEELHNSGDLAYRLGLNATAIHRLKYKVIQKLKRIPTILLEAQEEYENNSTYTSDSGNAAMRRGAASSGRIPSE